jgi:hypothetical protein
MAHILYLFHYVCPHSATVPSWPKIVALEQLELHSGASNNLVFELQVDRAPSQLGTMARSHVGHKIKQITYIKKIYISQQRIHSLITSASRK